jgi:hypothetical protein
MFFHRKNFGGVWELCELNKDEFVSASKRTVNSILRARHEIKNAAKEAKMTLEPLEVAAAMISYALLFNSHASDIIESQKKSEREALLRAATPTADPENQTQ